MPKPPLPLPFSHFCLMYHIKTEFVSADEYLPPPPASGDSKYNDKNNYYLLFLSISKSIICKNYSALFVRLSYGLSFHNVFLIGHLLSSYSVVLQVQTLFFCRCKILTVIIMLSFLFNLLQMLIFHHHYTFEDLTHDSKWILS